MSALTNSRREPLPDEAYARVFVNHPEGKEVLEDLVTRFYRAGFVAGGHEGDRQTCYNAGNRGVIDYILAKINRAAGVDDSNAEV